MANKLLILAIAVNFGMNLIYIIRKKYTRANNHLCMAIFILLSIIYKKF